MKNVNPLWRQIGVSFAAGLIGGFVAIAVTSIKPQLNFQLKTSDPTVTKAVKSPELPYIAACKEDLKLDCSSAPAEEGGDVGCLLDKQSVSLSCKEALSFFVNRLNPCHEESQKFCPGISIGKARLIKCLRQSRSKITNNACLSLL